MTLSAVVLIVFKQCLHLNVFYTKDTEVSGFQLHVLKQLWLNAPSLDALTRKQNVTFSTSAWVSLQWVALVGCMSVTCKRGGVSHPKHVLFLCLSLLACLLILNIFILSAETGMKSSCEETTVSKQYPSETGL